MGHETLRPYTGMEVPRNYQVRFKLMDFVEMLESQERSEEDWHLTLDACTRASRFALAVGPARHIFVSSDPEL